MIKHIFPFLITLILFSACSPDKTHQTAFGIYCEMVANGAKPIALHYPMEPSEVNTLWPDFEEIAASYDVELYREDNFPDSGLFPANLTENKTVTLIYKGDRLTQYEQWKQDVTSSDGQDQEALARRFGRLLGYTPQGINELLRKNSDFKDLASFDVKKQITHLYYEDLKSANEFYNNVLGLNQVKPFIFQIGEDAFLKLNAQNEDHPKGQTKSTAIALLTDQLPDWYAHLQAQNVPIKYTYKPREGGPHDGFVVIDPEGYLLEFEQFKQHPENELFMAALRDTERVKTSIGELNFYGSITWTYHNDLLKMQQFYDEILGYRLVADQGWTKIYQTSESGFIGLVDERRGMEDYADTKAVEIEWSISSLDELGAYATEKWAEYAFENNTFKGPEKYIYHTGGAE